MLPLPLPVEPPMWALARVRMTRPEAAARFGPPHYTETDGTRTAGGDEDCWAFTIRDGQRVMIVLGVPYDDLVIHADPPNVGPVLRALEIEPDDPGLEVFPSPVALT